jgi:hypothetical protein
VPNVTVFVGARPYLLTEQEALRLAALLRGAAAEQKTEEAAAGLRLARALDLAAVGGLNETVEIGRPQAEAVARALPEVTAHAYDGLELLLHAARRLAGDANPDSGASA